VTSSSNAVSLVLGQERTAYHEAKKLGKKNSAIGETFAGRPNETGKAETQAAREDRGRSKESQETVTRTSPANAVAASGKSSRYRERRTKAEEKTESIAGTSRTTGRGNESTLGCQASRSGEPTSFTGHAGFEFGASSSARKCQKKRDCILTMRAS
jgi:hypothetical protein